ncbi:glycosyl hydrolase family protein [bacterium]|nr:MAG: glycosyl hydrolase family protein [bacterium]
MNKLLFIQHQKSVLIAVMAIVLLSSVTASAYINTALRQDTETKIAKTAEAAKKSAPNTRSNTSSDTPGQSDDNTQSPDKERPTAAPNNTSTPSTASGQKSQGSTSTASGSNIKPSESSGSGNTSGGSSTTPTTPATPTCPAGQTGTPPNCATLAPKPVGVAGSWTLKFQDEFNGTSLNTSVWATQRGEASGPYGNPYNPQYEDAFYLANNPKVSNGNLVLTLNKETTNGYPYSSGMVQNGRSFSYKYGYTEARVKVPGNTGVWPAYWTLASPIDKYWPPEIDIFEFGMDGSNTHPFFNYHYGSYPNNGQFGVKQYGNAAINYSHDFHTYGMLWRSNIIQIYIDGQPGPSYTTTSNITSLPQYLIFNLGLKKGANVPSGTSMQVDYVRVWQ